MSKLIDLTGQTFNMLTVIERDLSKKGTYWKCQCGCENKTITSVKASNLKSGAVKSCGCLKHQSAWNKTHGESKTKLYRHWVCMMRRCYDPKHTNYQNYGARGIKVCEEWHIYENFRDWTLKTRQDENLTCERMNNDGDYCPENCIWIPLGEQANNRRSSVVIAYNGKTQNLMQWCKELNLYYPTVHSRMYKYGWDFEKAIGEPVKSNQSQRSD